MSRITEPNPASPGSPVPRASLLQRLISAFLANLLRLSRFAGRALDGFSPNP